jgi:hypothetical protein
MSFSDPTGKLGPHQRDRRYKAKVVYESQSFVDEKGKPLPISEVAKRLKVGVKGAPAAAPKAERAGNGNLPFGPALQRSLMDRVRGKDAAGAQSMLARYEDRSQLGLTRLTEALPGVYDWIVLTARSGKHRGNLVLAQIVSRDSDDVVTYKVFGSGEEDYLVSSELISHAKNVFEVGRDTEERSASRWEAVKRWLGFGPKRAPTAGLPGEGKPPATAPTPLIPRNQAVAAELASMTFTMGLELPSVLAELNVVHEQFSPRTRTPVQLNLEGTTEARELLAAFTGNVAGDNAPEALAQQAVATVLASNADSHMNPRDVAEQVWQRVMPVLAASARVRGVTVNTDWAKPMLNRVTVVVRGALENHAVNAMDVSLLFEAEPDDPLRLAVEAQLRDVLNGNRPVAIFCANMAQDELENRLAVYTAQASNRQFVLIGNPATTGKADMARVKMKAASRLGLASIFLRIYTDNPDRLTNLDRAAVLEILRILAGMKLEPVLSLPSLLEAKVTDIQA